jgi:WbqC-like protein family
MKVAIMQPYFFPYIGYFQLLKAADVFVVYDNIKYTKKGWINRNRFLQNGMDEFFSIPLQKDSDLLDVVDRTIAPVFDKKKLLNQIRAAYARAPGFEAAFALFEQCVTDDESNLFRFILHAIERTAAALGITTRIVVSSSIPIDHTLRGQDKVLALCEALGARTYVNAIGGTSLYEPEAFEARAIDLRFLRSRPIAYPQFGSTFVPWLSILDVLMFNEPGTVRALLDECDLIVRPDETTSVAA